MTAPSGSLRSPRSWLKVGGRLVFVTVQVNVSVSNKPPGSSTRTTTAYGEPEEASSEIVPEMSPVAGAIDRPVGRPVADQSRGSP